MTENVAPSPLGVRIGYLLKHANQRFLEESAQAMAPFGIDGRELAVLSVLATEVPLSQLEAAKRLRVDRTTMVALVDALEAKGLVERRRSTEDRRKNTIQLTPTGEDLLRRGEAARVALQERFLSRLAPGDAEPFLRALQVLAEPAAG